MASTLVHTKPRRLDFLRHIVNKILASMNIPPQYIDDIRRAVGRAEDKYKFNAFGGDVRKLADYLKSRDFDDLLMQAKAEGKGVVLEAIKRILEEAKKAYNDIPEVVEAIEARLKEIEAGVGEEAERKLETLQEMLRDLERQGLKTELRKDERKLLVTYGDKAKLLISFDDKKKSYIIEYAIKDRIEISSAGEVRGFIASKLLPLLRKS